MDFYHDTTKDQLCHIIHQLQKNGVNPPNYVMTKTAHEEKGDLPQTSYAYPEEKKFPIHTPADTWLSAAYFSHKQADIPKNAKDRIKGMIHKGAELWDIPLDQLKEIDRVLAPALEKQAGDDENTVDNEEDFQKYCSDALEKFPEMNLSQRKHISDELLKTADEQDWQLDGDTRKKLEQSACKGYGLRDKVTNFLYDVKTRIPKRASEVHEIVDTCMRDLNQKPNFPDQDTLYKTAALTDMVLKNKSVHLKNMNLPEREIFNISQSEADKARNSMVQLPGRRVVWKHAIENNHDSLAADLYAMTGKELSSTDEIIGEMKNLTPVVSDKLLSELED